MIKCKHCKDCNRFFAQDEGFCRMRPNPKITTLPIDKHISNLSNNKMKNQLIRHLGVNLNFGDNKRLDLIKLSSINN